MPPNINHPPPKSIVPPKNTPTPMPTTFISQNTNHSYPKN